MKVFIMRHAEAEGFIGKTDFDRNLTEHGYDELATIVSWLKSEQVTISHIFVSPYHRAQQTSNFISQQLEFSGITKTMESIIPEGSAISFHDYLDGDSSLQADSVVLVVSHMPLVSFLVDELTYESITPIFQTAAIATINYNLTTMKGDFVGLKAPIDLK